MTNTDPPEEPPKETDMDIHKLKPIHSWRDFLKELGTIVLGSWWKTGTGPAR